MSGIPQAILVKEAVYALAVATATDGIGDIVFVGAEELCQAVAVKVGIGIDVVGRIHEVTDTAEELLFGSEVVAAKP